LLLSAGKYNRKSTTLASKEYKIHNISSRVLSLSKLLSTNKEFIKKCEISNHSLITDIKKGRIKIPGAEVLAQIVKGTGCNGTWLLTGDGDMFSNDANLKIEDGISPMLIQGFLGFIDEVEKNSKALEKISIPEDINLRLASLLLTLLKSQKLDKKIH